MTSLAVLRLGLYGGSSLFYLSSASFVDARLQLVDGRMLSRLRQQDLPQAAKAIVGYTRGLVTAERVFSRQVPYYRFLGPGLDCIILATDFVKIIPLLKNGVLDPLQYPVPPIYPADPVNPDLSGIDQWDPVFYARVYNQLLRLFPESYPTSNI